MAALTPGAWADEVKLRSYVETDSQNGNGIVVFPSEVVDRVEGSDLHIFWGRGVGYTNDWRYWSLDTYQFTADNPAGPGSITFYGIYFTNQTFHGWSGSALADGTQSDVLRTVMKMRNEANMEEVTDTSLPATPTNNPSPSFNYNDSPPWLAAKYVYTDTNTTPSRTFDLSRKSEVDLITTPNLSTTGKALFRLTASLKDAYQQAITNGYTVASNTPNAAGEVFAVFNDGTTNPVTPAITATNTITNYSFTITPQRVQLTGLLWWNPVSSNWSSGPLFVMSNSTVTFTITANVDDVVWPTNLPVWNCEGTTQNGGTTFTHTFTTVSQSADTPVLITATAGNTKTNSAVVYTVSPSMTPEDNFSGRSTNQFGVCEILNFGLTITPGDMSGSEIAMIDWVFTTSPTNATVSINNSGHGSVTLFGPSIPATVNVALTVSDNFRALTNSWTYPFIIPSSLVCVPTTVTIFDSAGVSHGPSVWHEVNSGSVGKKLLFYLFPSAVSFREIHIREGVSTNEFATGIFTNQAPHNVGGWRTVGSGDSTTGSLVNTVDTSDTGLIGANQPRSVFQPNGGTFGYDIWIEYKRTTESDNMARKAFTVPYRVTVSGNGRTELKKDGMTPIAREWDDPYSNY